MFCSTNENRSLIVGARSPGIVRFWTGRAGSIFRLYEQIAPRIACSYEGVMALSRMMKTDQPNIKGQTGAANAGEGDLYTMMKNPKYWREKDPSFIAQVTAGFEKLYANK